MGLMGSIGVELGVVRGVARRGGGYGVGCGVRPQPTAVPFLTFSTARCTLPSFTSAPITCKEIVRCVEGRMVGSVT